MPQRQAVTSALDVGRHSFGAFIDEHLSKLRLDLLRECDRIAAARELLLKKQLSESRKQNEELQAKLQNVTKMAADGALQLVKGHGNDSITNSSEAQDIASMGTPHLDLDQVAADIDPSLERSPEDADVAENSDSFTLWVEWKDSGKDSVRSSVIGQQLEQEKEVGAGGKNSAWDTGTGKELLNLPRSRYAVSPNSTLFVCWEVLGIPILFYDLVTIPMQVFHKPKGILFNIISWVLILYWTGDLLLRLLIVGHVTHDGMVMLERKVFMKIYLRRSFAFDFCMVAPDWFSKVAGASGMRNVAILRLLRILRLMRLMRMSKMKKLFRALEDTIDSEYFTVIVSIVVNLLSILGMCHYLACFWFWLGTIELHGHPSWVEQHLQNDPWEYQYVMSLHWAIAQFTPGASKIQPVNILEAVGSITILVVGLIFMAVFISALSQARARLQALTSKIDRDNWMLRRYLRQQGVSIDLQVRTMRYVERCVEPMFARVQRKDVFLLPLISRPLQLEVQEEQYFHTLTAHPLLKRLRERSLSLTLHLFMNVVIEIQLADADLLFEVGDVAHEMYFVRRGTLAYLHHGGISMDRVDVGSWCSEAVLWVEWVHNGTAKAISDSQVISLDSAKMRAAVLDHKERLYVSRCAKEYVKDLNALLDKGEVITDLTKLTDDPSSAYMEAVCQKSVGNKDEVTPDLTKLTNDLSSDDMEAVCQQSVGTIISL